MNEAWIIDACRTPRGIGKKGKGALAHLHPQHLGATVLAALAERTGIDTAEVDDIIFGTSNQRGQQQSSLMRLLGRTVHLALPRCLPRSTHRSRGSHALLGFRPC